MKNLAFSKNQIKLFITLIIFLSTVQKNYSQADTLHVNYIALQTKMPDSTEAKIEAWAKKLNGQHVDVEVIAYYHEGEFKKYSAERNEEMFIILNRKARDLITLKSNTTKKGAKSQRSRVDVIYKSSDGSALVKTEASKNTSSDKKTNTSTSGSSQTSSGKTTGTAPANKEFVAKEQFKARKLAVVLLEESAEQVEKLKDNAAELSVYRANIKLHNDNITNAFKTYWKASAVEFLKESQLEAGKLDDKAQNWVLLLPGKSLGANIPFMNYNVAQVYKDANGMHISANNFKISLLQEMPNEADFLVLMNKMKVFYGIEKEFQLEQLEETLPKKTLYVDAAMTEVSKDEFREVYPYPFEFKTTDEINEKIKKAEKDILYLKLDAQYGNMTVMIIDAATGATMAHSPMSGISSPSESSSFAIQNELSDYEGINYKRCLECPLSGTSVIKNLKEKAKINKTTVKELCNEKKQIKYSNPLTIY